MTYCPCTGKPFGLTSSWFAVAVTLSGSPKRSVIALQTVPKAPVAAAMTIPTAMGAKNASAKCWRSQDLTVRST